MEGACEIYHFDMECDGLMDSEFITLLRKLKN